MSLRLEKPEQNRSDLHLIVFIVVFQLDFIKLLNIALEVDQIYRADIWVSLTYQYQPKRPILLASVEVLTKCCYIPHACRQLTQ